MKKKEMILYRTFRWVFLIFLLMSTNGFAYDVEVGGIYYNLDSNAKTAEVTYKDFNIATKSYSGTVNIPSSFSYSGINYTVKTIGNACFASCKMSSVIIPNSVTSIKLQAFSGCSNLTSITIPNSVYSIDMRVNPFYGCDQLTTIEVDRDNYWYDSRDNCNAIIRTSSNQLICGCKTTTIPASITSIGENAFAGCSGLKSVTIPNSITSIADAAFFGCSGLTTITIPNNVTIIGSGAFNGCSGLISVTISKGLTSISSSAFQNCSGLVSVTIPNSVTSIGNSAFDGCGSLSSVTIPNSITSIGDAAFRNCTSLTSVAIPNSVFSIGMMAFDGCKNIETIALPEKITSIEDAVFQDCSNMISVSIPNSVKSIGRYAFLRCEKLTSIILSENVTTMGYGAFSDCSNLMLVRSLIKTPFSIDNNVFYGIPSSAKLEVPKGTKSKYQTFPGWTYYFKEIVEFGSTSTYTLSITASGNGSASYNNTTIRSKTSSFTVDEGTSATIIFTPDNGYRIKSVKVNNTTVSVSNNQYTISSINANTTVSVEFEAIPITTYTLSITASGGGSASYSGTIVRGKTSSFTVNAGSSATITFSPDNGYRIKSVKVNSADATSSVSNNQYTISNITNDTSVEVEFEAIPPTTYTLSIKASGNGSASYSGSIIKDKTSTFTVNEGDNATITFSPNAGYRIKSVKVNSTDVTSSVSNNSYTISNITKDTSVEVDFEVIPPTTYTLSIKVSGNGSALYSGTAIKDKTSTFTVNEGANATITFSPDAGHWIKSVKVNSTDITSSVSNNQYTISNITKDTSVEVEFEAIPPTTYTLSITATGNGSASYSGTTVRDKTSTFTVNDGTKIEISLNPDNGYRVKSIKENNEVVTSYILNGVYTISSLSRNTTIEVEFEAELKAFSADDVNFTVVSVDDRTVRLAKGSYGITLEVPAKVNYQDVEWTVVGIDNGALANNLDLAAIIWHAEAAFTENVDNPNMLLYVKSASYAPSSIKNVVVNGAASSIVLSDVLGKNDFYCPKEFTAQKVSYMHHYMMETGIGNARGWETIALPFDVQKITHQSKGEIVPFANWKSGDAKKPFWLMTYGSSGWVEANSIKANTPYIISMPNHSNYKSEFRLNGNVTFSAENVTIPTSDNLLTSNYNGRIFSPNYANQSDNSYYALNVNNDYVTYSGNDLEGSKFLIGLRTVHPFEAYMTSASQARMYIAIDEDMTTGIGDITEIMANEKVVRVYNLNGQLIMEEENKSVDEIKVLLSAGVYIANGKKIIIK